MRHNEGLRLTAQDNGDNWFKTIKAKRYDNKRQQQRTFK